MHQIVFKHRKYNIIINNKNDFHLYWLFFRTFNIGEIMFNVFSNKLKTIIQLLVATGISQPFVYAFAEFCYLYLMSFNTKFCHLTALCNRILSRSIKRQANKAGYFCNMKYATIKKKTS